MLFYLFKVPFYSYLNKDTHKAADAAAAQAAIDSAVHDSRFDTVDNAIEFAEANGQGDLSVAGDGTITNRFGETMVYDSTGNLAPAPRDTPIMDPGIIF